MRRQACQRQYCAKRRISSAAERTPVKIARISATAAIGIAALTVAPASANGHSSEVRVTGHGVASAYNRVSLLTGSATHAVYSVTRAEVDGSGDGDGKSRSVCSPFGPGPARRSASAGCRIAFRQDVSRRRAGGSSRGQREVQATHPDDRRMERRDPAPPRPAVGQGGDDRRGTPDGFVYTLGRRLHEWVGRTDSYRSWGTPFPKQGVASFSADHRSLIVTGLHHGAKLMAFSRPGSYRRLHTGKGTYYCDALNHSGAACEIVRKGPPAVGYLPLDGGAPVITSHPGVMLDLVALSGPEVLYTGEVTDNVAYLYGFSESDAQLPEGQPGLPCRRRHRRVAPAVDLAVGARRGRRQPPRAHRRGPLAALDLARPQLVAPAGSGDSAPRARHHHRRRPRSESDAGRARSSRCARRAWDILRGRRERRAPPRRSAARSSAAATACRTTATATRTASRCSGRAPWRARSAPRRRGSPTSPATRRASFAPPPGCAIRSSRRCSNGSICSS